MSHPCNRLERRNIGEVRCKKRVYLFLTEKEAKERPDLLKYWSRRHRNTTKTCSCSMCGNPRKFYNQKTMQEIKYGSGPIYLDE